MKKLRSAGFNFPRTREGEELKFNDQRRSLQFAGYRVEPLATGECFRVSEVDWYRAYFLIVKARE